MAANGFRHSTISNMWGIGSYNVIGENIAMGYGSGTTAGTLHVAWMNSSGHRENMLSPQFDSVGIGVFCAADGSMWATTSFAAPRRGRTRAPRAAGVPPVNPIVRSDPGSALPLTPTEPAYRGPLTPTRPAADAAPRDRVSARSRGTTNRSRAGARV